MLTNACQGVNNYDGVRHLKHQFCQGWGVLQVPIKPDDIDGPHQQVQQRCACACH